MYFKPIFTLKSTINKIFDKKLTIYSLKKYKPYKKIQIKIVEN